MEKQHRLLKLIVHKMDIAAEDEEREDDNGAAGRPRPLRGRPGPGGRPRRRPDEGSGPLWAVQALIGGSKD